MLKRQVVSAMTLVLLFCSHSNALDLRPNWKNLNISFFGMVGGSTLFDSRYFKSADEVYHSSYTTGNKIVFGTGVPINNIFTIETSYMVGPNTLLVTNTSHNPHTFIEYPMRSHSLSIGGTARSPVAILSFRPYAAAAWDYTRYAPTLAANVIANNISGSPNGGFGAVSTAQLNEDKKIGLSIGVGLEHKISGRLNLRIEARDHVTTSPNFGLPSSGSTTAIFPVGGYANNIVYSIGFIYRIGKKFK